MLVSGSGSQLKNRPLASVSVKFFRYVILFAYTIRYNSLEPFRNQNCVKVTLCRTRVGNLLVPLGQIYSYYNYFSQNNLLRQVFNVHLKRGYWRPQVVFEVFISQSWSDSAFCVFHFWKQALTEVCTAKHAEHLLGMLHQTLKRTICHNMIFVKFYDIIGLVL